MIDAYEEALAVLQAQEPKEARTLIEIGETKNKLAEAQQKLDEVPPIELHGADKEENKAAWTTYNTRISNLELHRGKVFAMIEGQCTQALLDQMKSDAQYSTVMQSQDPLALKAMIDRIIVNKSETMYPYATIMEQWMGLLNFQQQTL